MTAQPCRICGAAAAVGIGTVEYLEGLPCEILDCAACGCRWTPPDATVHPRMHRQPAISYYADYGTLLEQCRTLVQARDAGGLHRVLSGHTKYRFVLDRLQQLAPGARVLEWGCSRGYLTAASILAGRPVLGVDVSADAIAAARAAFGDHFACVDSPRIDAGAPYDAIYHVGLIGCVPDPVGLTHRLLTLLKPGGRLFFNAPNRDALFRLNQLWFDSAPAPELITLFPGGFFQRRFGEIARVVETILVTSPQESTIKSATRWFGPAWRAPVAHPMQSDRAHRWVQPKPPAAWATFEAMLSKLATITRLRIGRWPEEYGYFVEMTR
jgi:SAM-dependent methyltransferase